MDDRQSYCTLTTFNYPKTWEEKDEYCSDYETVLRRINEIWVCFSDQKCLQEDVDENESIEDSNMSVILKNRWNSQIQVGFSRFGWLLLLMNPGEKSRFLYNKDPNKQDLIVFLFPEWTEIKTERLLSSDIAKAVIKIWLDCDDIPDHVWRH